MRVAGRPKVSTSVPGNSAGPQQLAHRERIRIWIELDCATFRSQSSPGSHIALQKAERSRIIMAYMAFSGHDSEQPVNPSDVHLVINSVPAFIHTAVPDGLP